LGKSFRAQACCSASFSALCGEQAAMISEAKAKNPMASFGKQPPPRKYDNKKYDTIAS
jgi:hypothetical protein